MLSDTVFLQKVISSMKSFSKLANDHCKAVSLKLAFDRLSLLSSQCRCLHSIRGSCMMESLCVSAEQMLLAVIETIVHELDHGDQNTLGSNNSFLVPSGDNMCHHFLEVPGQDRHGGNRRQILFDRNS